MRVSLARPLSLSFVLAALACTGDDPALVQPPNPAPGPAADAGPRLKIAIEEVPALSLPLGRRTTAALRIVRNGVAGPIRLTASNVPAKVDVPPLEIPADRSDVELALTAAADAPQIRSVLTIKAEGDGAEPGTRDVPVVVRDRAGGLDRTLTPIGAFVATAREVNDASVDDRGRIYFLGTATEGCALFRYLPTGEVDTTFGTNGVVILETSPRFGGATPLRCERMSIAGGKIAIAGVLPTLIAKTWVARLSLDGEFDPTFAAASGGLYQHDDLDATSPRALALEASGALRLVIARAPTTTASFSVQRLTAEGSAIPGPKAEIALPADAFWRFNASLEARSLAAEGAIFVAGGFTADANLDTRLGSSGISRHPVANVTETPVSVEPVGDRGWLMLGVREANGTRETVVGLSRPPGQWEMPIGGAGSGVRRAGEGNPRFTAAIGDADQSLLVVGTRTGKDAKPFPFAARYTASNAPDPTFGDLGVAEHPALDATEARWIFKQADGVVFVLRSSTGLWLLARLWL